MVINESKPGTRNHSVEVIQSAFIEKFHSFANNTSVGAILMCGGKFFMKRNV